MVAQRLGSTLAAAALALALATAPGAAAAAGLIDWLFGRYEPPTPAPDPPMLGQVSADADNPAWLSYGDGRPFFMCGPGDPEGFLYRGARQADGTRDGDQGALIGKMAGTGANAIYLMAVRSHGGDGDETQNPFVDHDPSEGLSQPILDQWETWFRAMDEAGIVIFFILYDDSARIWDTGDRVGDEERAFVTAMVDRFEHHLHLIWVIAEEYQERYTARRVSHIAAEIRAADDFDHPIAVHKWNGLDFAEFADDPHIDQFAIQFDADGPAALHAAIARTFAEARGRYNLNLAESHPAVSGAELRRRNWAAAMGGAFVMALGMDIAGTPRADLEDCGRLVRFMERVDVRGLAPHDELAAAGTEYVLADPGKRYVAYAANGPERLGLSGLTAGRYDMTWFDPASGATVEQAGIEVQGGEQAWPRPGEFGPEVALYLRPAGG